jgi:hypothetical protein
MTTDKIVAKVLEVVSDCIIEVDTVWHFGVVEGRRVRIAGLLPAKFEDRDNEKKKLETLILNEEVEIDQFLYVSAEVLTATVHKKFGHLNICNSFPHRMLPIHNTDRLSEADEHEMITKVSALIPSNWKNPINILSNPNAPFFGNLRYPVKFWERSYDREIRHVNTIFTNTNANKDELNRWFDVFLNSPHREAPLMVIGNVGIGKSWWIAKKLMDLDRNKYHPIIIDMRYMRRHDKLENSIEKEIDEFLCRYVKGSEWIHPDLEYLFPDNFNPEEPSIKDVILKEVTNLSLHDKNRKRFRYYNGERAPKLIICFDNIDHFEEDEQAVILDLCRRIVGNPAGVKIIVAIRPTTQMRKSRLGVFFGDTLPKPLVLKSPNIYQLLNKRLMTNMSGGRVNPREKIIATNMTWFELLRKYRDSDHPLGMARFLKDLCCHDCYDGMNFDENLYPYQKIVKKSISETYDIRHFMRLFRRLIRSDVLMDLNNISSMYFGIHALLLKEKSSMSEPDSFLFNLFDNEKPEEKGNALIRYRVLEYCKNFFSIGQEFDLYFEALGCGTENARYVLNQFEDAGLIRIEYAINSQGKKVPTYGRLTIPGMRHLEIITNLWYIICIKTGMNIYKECIIYGEEALLKASEFVKSEEVLKHYSSMGWVPEDKFLEFLFKQEQLERKRIGRFQKENPKLFSKIANRVESLSSPSEILYYAISEQIARWKN